MLEYGYQYSVEEIEDDDADTDEDAVDEETLINKEANEEFSVRKAENGMRANNKGIIIERAAMKKKNWNSKLKVKTVLKVSLIYIKLIKILKLGIVGFSFWKLLDFFQINQLFCFDYEINY